MTLHGRVYTPEGLMTLQNALPPYEFRCLACGQTWTPEAKGKRGVTDHALERSAAAHLDECPAVHRVNT